MIITINSKQEKIEGDEITISRLMELKNISPNGTAVAVNGMLCPKGKWAEKHLREGDDVMVITAAYGG